MNAGRNSHRFRRNKSALPRSRWGDRAFTVLELLVAAGITTMLAGFIFVIIRNVSTTWTGATGRLGADAQARIVLDQLTVDLQGALFRDDGNVWFAADVLDRTSNSGTLWTEAARNVKPTGTGANGSLNLITANIADGRFGKAGIWLPQAAMRRAAAASGAAGAAGISTCRITVPAILGLCRCGRLRTAGISQAGCALDWVYKSRKSQPSLQG